MPIGAARGDDKAVGIASEIERVKELATVVGLSDDGDHPREGVCARSRHRNRYAPPKAGAFQFADSKIARPLTTLTGQLSLLTNRPSAAA
jgi:hypothetical protein